MKILLILLSTSLLLMAQKNSYSSGLKLQLDSIINSHQGNFAVAFYNVTTGESLYIHEREKFHAASTMKTPVMVEVYKQVAQKRFSLKDSIDVVNSFKSIIDGSEYSLSLSDDSEDGLYGRIGTKETIAQLVYKMITVSSNLSTNILIEKIGPINVMNTMKELGLFDIEVLRGVEDGKAYSAGKNNTTTAYDLSLLFTQLAKGTIISQEACSSMLDILRAQKFNTMIPAQLPNNVIVAHKTGSITNVQHDTGIIYLPNGQVYVLVLLSKNLNSNKEGIEVLASLSKAVYDFVVQ